MPDVSGIKRGTRVKFTYSEKELLGTFLGKYGEYYSIKLENGYDIRIIPEKIDFLEEEVHHENAESRKKSVAGSGKEISLITTGGTIVSKVDYTTGAVFPSLDITEITSKFPYLEERFRLRHVNFLNILSENMEPENWIGIAETVARESKKSQGIVISHGTDTMTYTAAALSFMLSRLSVPVILTGSQKSSDRPSSDSFMNLEGAINFAGTDLGEVCIAMHQAMSDDRVSLLRGVRARKMHSTRRDAFRSIGEPPMGVFMDGKAELNGDYRRVENTTEINTKLETRVGMLYSHPGMQLDDMESMMERKRGIVVMGTGLGHISVKFLPLIKKYTGDGGRFLISSQCINGPVNLDVYATGRELASAGATWVENILPETALVKMMHVMANYPEEDFEKMMRTNMRGEILYRETAGGF